MKAIIYAGIGLFSAASIYGVADFYHEQKNGRLLNLYKNAPEFNQEDISSKKAMKDVDLEDYSRARIDEPVAIKTMSPIAAVKENQSTKTPLIKTLPEKKKAAKQKRPNIKFSDFSRSRLVIEEVLPLPEKIDTTIKL